MKFRCRNVEASRVWDLGPFCVVDGKYARRETRARILKPEKNKAVFYFRILLRRG